ncbi:methyltransferase [Flavobacterium sp. LS1R47]|uniref:Methyltransferase n=1 Tax=Flavobacterium frigoritolerans TaxID=2987686 RepID=A0A9X2ZNC6_9FLAO|nr:methyltransferase [Flavobacterium frigoritolerans]MCV9931802.1 methyltransferase [Flavobacterium frigoritolerans]
MAITDSSGQNFSTHDFNQTDDILNIEFGAGSGFFGKKNYPKCYTTDLSFPEKNHFSLESSYDKDTNCHYIDFECDFLSYNFGTKKFETIIICNPYGYGIRRPTEGKNFFDRIGNLLSESGALYVITQENNGYFNSKVVKKQFNKNLDNEFKSSYAYDWHSYDNEGINTHYAFVRDFDFFTCTQRKINPNVLFKFTKQA